MTISSLSYQIGSKNPGSQFLDIQMSFEVSDFGKPINVQLPSWRPGRYELGDFAKNVFGFTVKQAGVKVSTNKVKKDLWSLDIKKNGLIEISYQYFCEKLDAGSCWVDENQLYVNPVNVLMYVEGYSDVKSIVNIDCPKDFEVVTGLKKSKKYVYKSSTFDELADSPILASNQIQKKTYSVKGQGYEIVFNGICNPDWKKILKDFKAFTAEQVAAFGSFPVKEYKFINQILPYRAYHGVEHLNTTMIVLGPGYDLMKDNYEHLLGVSSHELYHAWNIKTIRPQEMSPYDFSKENYTRLGFVAEGVTTYYGDLMLARSGVFNWTEYLKTLNEVFDRHLFSYGKDNLSVADSSFDTWLDGYEKGAPNRKTSIYTEGCLNALMFDLYIIKTSKGKYSLDNVMKELYQNDAPYCEKSFEDLLVKYSDTGIKKILKEHTYGTKSYLPTIKKLMSEFGLQLKPHGHSQILATKFGVRLELNSNKVFLVAPNSEASEKGIQVGDEVLAVNGISVDNKSVQGWVEYFGKSIDLTIKKNALHKKIKLKEGKQKYFESVRVVKKEKASLEQKKAFKRWIKLSF